jgi:hypothetical protein
LPKIKAPRKAWQQICRIKLEKTDYYCKQIIESTMDIDAFKEMGHNEKLQELRYNGQLLGSYQRNTETGSKIPGDIFELYDFWVFLSDDESMVIPTRKNPLSE